MEASQGQWQSPRTYPDDMRVYGIVVDDRLGSPVIRVGLDALARHGGDLLVFLCIPPHDIRARTDWDELQSHLPASSGRRMEFKVLQVHSPAELLQASLEMRVLRLPTDDIVI